MDIYQLNKKFLRELARTSSAHTSNSPVGKKPKISLDVFTHRNSKNSLGSQFQLKQLWVTLSPEYNIYSSKNAQESKRKTSLQGRKESMWKLYHGKQLNDKISRRKESTHNSTVLQNAKERFSSHIDNEKTRCEQKEAQSLKQVLEKSSRVLRGYQKELEKKVRKRDELRRRVRQYEALYGAIE